MTQKSYQPWFVACVLFLLSAGIGWGFFSQQTRLSSPALLTKTAEERRATLDAFKAAWDERPGEYSPANARAEKDFINRTAVLVQRGLQKEIGREAYSFYQRTVNDFFARYGSEDILAR